MNNSIRNQMNHSHVSSHYAKNNYPIQNGNRSFRLQSSQIWQQIRSLEDEIQFTISNYESIFETEKKNTNERNEFLLYLIQTMKQKHNQELSKYQAQLEYVLQQKQQATTLESQMKNIGQGIESILEQGKKLKNINQSLQKQVEEQSMRQKQLDDEIQSYNKTIYELRQDVDEWGKEKLKWHRKKKDLIQIIEDAEKQLKITVCRQTGIEQENCQHCQNLKVKRLMLKYQNNGKSI